MRYETEQINNLQLGAFLSLFIVVLIVAEVILRQISPSLISYDKEVRDSIASFENRASDIELLFLGNSQTVHAINPEFMQNSGLKIHNFGYANEPIRTTYWKVKYYLDRGLLPQLKSVFLQLIIYDKREIRHEYNYHKYYNYIDIIRELDLNEWYEFTLSHLYIYRVGRNILKKIADGSVRTISKYGFRIAHDKLSDEAFNHYINKVKNSEYEEYIIDNLNILYYKKLMDMLTGHGIRVYVYTLPTPLTYSKLNKNLDQKM